MTATLTTALLEIRALLASNETLTIEGGPVDRFVLVFRLHRGDRIHARAWVRTIVELERTGLDVLRRDIGVELRQLRAMAERAAQEQRT